MIWSWNDKGTKEQFLNELRIRVGRGSWYSSDPAFVFDTLGDRSLLIPQLEAVVEFYLNFRQPWGGGEPLPASDPEYVTVSLTDPHGEAASTGHGAVVTLDGAPDLSTVIPNPPDNPPAGAAADGASPPSYPARLKYLYDTLWLDADRARPSKTYRVMAVDDKAKTVTLDAAPNCPDNTSSWRLNRRPTIVIIDPFGPRVFNGITLAGTQAKVAGTDPHDRTRTILSLDKAVPLDRVNAGFDTIHLDTDTVTTPARPGPVYRIAAVDPAAHTVSVAGAPSLDGGVSAWQIPSGVGGVAPNLNYDLGPQYARNPNGVDEKSRGYDHYDAALFIVHRGQVAGGIYRWTSYTSRAYGTWSPGDNPPFRNWQQELSSVGGNALYQYASFRSDEKFKNFSFAVVDAKRDRTLAQNVAADAIATANYYTGTPAPPVQPVPANPNTLDPRVWGDSGPKQPGKRLVRLHRGNFGHRFGTGSAGCLVAIDYVTMRTDLVALFEKDYREFHGPGTFDADVHRVFQANTNVDSVTLYLGHDAKGNPVPPFPEGGWDSKVVGNLWLIRPDERPVDVP